MQKHQVLRVIYFYAVLLWTVACIGAISLLSGCAIEAGIVGATFSAHLLKDKEVASTFNVQSGNQSSIEEVVSDPIYETQKYKQIQADRSVKPTALAPIQ